MRFKIVLIAFLATCIIPQNICAQNKVYKHDIQFKIIGLKDTTCVLAFHYGDKKLIKDSLKLDSKGICRYRGDSLAGGIYLFLLPDNRYFEFIFSGKEEKFSLETDTTLLMAEHMKVSNSYENKVYFDNLKIIGENSRMITEVNEWLKNNPKKADSVEIMRKKSRELNTAIRDSRLKLMEDHPDAFWSKVLMTMKEPEIPQSPRDENGNEIDSLFRFKYYKAHFLDNIDFSDERLLRTPLIQSKIKQYMEQLTLKHPDSIIVSCDVLTDKAEANKEVYQYVVVFLLNKYANDKIMGMDAVYVHLAKRHYCSGKAYWADEATTLRVCDLAKTWEPMLIGKVIPNVIFKDTNNIQIPIHGPESEYMVVIFYDPDCGHCKKALPKLANSADSLAELGTKVYAICTEFNREKWIKFIKEKKLGKFINVADIPYSNYFRDIFDIQSTPVIFVVDRNKEIIAKKLSVEQIRDFIERYDRMQKKKKKTDG